MFPRGNSQKGYDSDQFEKKGGSAEITLAVVLGPSLERLERREKNRGWVAGTFCSLRQLWLQRYDVASEQRGEAFSLLGVEGSCDPQAI